MKKLYITLTVILYSCGGGGGSNPVNTGTANRLGAAGGSGIVIIRYRFQ